LSDIARDEKCSQRWRDTDYNGFMRSRVLICLLAVLAVACTQAPTTDTADQAASDQDTSIPAAATTTDVGSASHVTVIANDLITLPAQPDDVGWPTERWVEAPLPDSADPDALAAVINNAFDTDPSPYDTIHAALVIKDGALVFERYGNGYDGDAPHDSWSIGKSVAHALTGVLVGDGNINVMGPAAVAEWREPDDPRGEITVDMLLRMSSGLEWTESSDARALFTMTDFGPAADIQVDRPLVADPDTVFNYSTGTTAIVGRIMANLVGVNPAFERWAHDELFDPIGITSVELLFDRENYWIAGYGANMTARDFARFGLLYLRDGMWDGERILPEGWVDYARSPSSTNDGYGSGFWLDWYGEGTVSAEGFLGQKVVLVPDEDLIVVVLADNVDGDDSGALVSDLIAAITGT